MIKIKNIGNMLNYRLQFDYPPSLYSIYRFSKTPPYFYPKNFNNSSPKKYPDDIKTVFHIKIPKVA